MEPLHPATRFTQILERIRLLIDSGQVNPGERLPSERELALALGVNRSSVREALRALASMGLVDIQHGRGVFVTAVPSAPETLLLELATGQVSAEVVPDLIEARRVVEGSLACLAAQRATPSDLEELGTLVDELARGAAQDPPSLAADTPFHLKIAEMSGNRVLASLVAITYRMAQEFFADYVATAEEARRIVQAHREVFESLRHGDADGTEARMHAHVDDSVDAFRRIASTRPAMQSGRTMGSGSGSGAIP